MIDLRLTGPRFAFTTLETQSSTAYFFRIGLIVDYAFLSGDLGCHPVSSAPDWKGDKSCLHYNWRGSLLGLPSGAAQALKVPYSSYNAIHDVTRLTANTYTMDYSALTQVGDGGGSYHFEFEYTANRVERRTECFAEWHWNHNYLIIYKAAHDSPISDNYKWLCTTTVIQVDVKSPTNVKLRSEDMIKAKCSSPRDCPEAVYPTGTWKTRTMYSVSADQYDGEAILTQFEDRMLHNAVRLSALIPPVNKEVWGDLADESAQNAQALDINSLAYARELVELHHAADAFIALARGKVSPKKLASAYLSFKYGLRLFLEDSRELTDALTRERHSNTKNYSVCRAKSSCTIRGLVSPLKGLSIRDEYYYKVYYSPIDDKFLSLIRTLQDWDVLPTLQNVWDLIPLSFVVDWFTDFSTTLGRIDANTYYNTLSVLGTIKTRKTCIWSIPVDRLSLPKGCVWSGNVGLDIYRRDLSPILDLPLFRIGSPDPFHHIVELGAIIVARR